MDRPCSTTTNELCFDACDGQFGPAPLQYAGSSAAYATNQMRSISHPDSINNFGTEPFSKPTQGYVQCGRARIELPSPDERKQQPRWAVALPDQQLPGENEVPRCIVYAAANIFLLQGKGGRRCHEQKGKMTSDPRKARAPFIRLWIPRANTDGRAVSGSQSQECMLWIYKYTTKTFMQEKLMRPDPTYQAERDLQPTRVSSGASSHDMQVKGPLREEFGDCFTGCGLMQAQHKRAQQSRTVDIRASVNFYFPACNTSNLPQQCSRFTYEEGCYWELGVPVQTKPAALGGRGSCVGSPWQSGVGPQEAYDEPKAKRARSEQNWVDIGAKPEAEKAPGTFASATQAQKASDEHEGKKLTSPCSEYGESLLPAHLIAHPTPSSRGYLTFSPSPLEGKAQHDTAFPAWLTQTQEETSCMLMSGADEPAADWAAWVSEQEDNAMWGFLP